MRITNSFFGVGPHHNVLYVLPATGNFTRVGYSLAEFDAARAAVNGAYNQPNWDGYNALGISDATKWNAMGVLNNLQNQTCAPEVTSNPNGTLSFEWDTSKGFGVLEIGRTRFSFYVQPVNGTPAMTSGEVTNINPAVGYLVDALLYPKPPHSVTAATLR